MVFRFEHRYTALIVSENGGFYHVDPHEIRPVHLFNISGRKYYVTRSSAPQTGAVALTSTNGAAAVLAPANMSYQQAAMKAAQICLTL